MDPDATLEELLKLAHAIRAAEDANHGEATVDPNEQFNLADHIIALDEWIRAGGFLPSAWRK